MERDRELEIRVGLFVVIALAVSVTGFVILGSESKLFEKRYALNASFSDVSGLRPGAAVQLSGLNVGLVSVVEFPTNLSEKQIYVRMNVVERFNERIRGDSVATIQSQGLLGDKYVSISVGSADREAMAEGSWLETRDPIELSAYLDDADDIIENVKSITRQIDIILKGDDAEDAGRSISEIFASLRNVIDELESGEGLIHQLVYDKKAGRQFKSIVANIDDTTAKLAAIATEVQEGEGTLHALVYEDQITGLLESLSGTAGKIDELVVEIQSGNGLIHDLVYTDGGQSMLASLTDASADIREVVSSVKRGEGTLGGLLVDPTIYEDVKTLLGKAQRNKIIKSYVRDTLRKNERAGGVTDTGPTAD